MKYKVLIVDDDADARDALGNLLGAAGFTALAAATAKEGLLAAVDSRPDLVLSDVSMPEVDGVEFCRRLKNERRTACIPVILLSSVRTGETDQVEGIEHGADDYLPKPVSPKLLFAKVQAVLRRYSFPGELEEYLKAEGLTLNPQSRTATLNGRQVSLTRKEFDLLTTFLRKRGRVLSVPYLLETVWGYDPADYNDPRTVETHISSLRRKLGPRLGKKLIKLYGLGYRFQP